MNILFQGIILGLSVAAPMGPTNFEIIRRGIKSGWKAAAVFCSGILVAVIISFLTVFFGLSFLTQLSLINSVLLVFGSLVLFYLAFFAIKDFFILQQEENVVKVDAGKNFISGIVLTLSNPVAIALWLSIIGGYLASGSTSLFAGILLGIGILFGEILFFIFLIGLIHKGRNHINQQHFRYISLGAGLILIYFGCTFVYKFVSLYFS